MYVFAGIVIALALVGTLTVCCWLGLLLSWAWNRFQAWRRCGMTQRRLDRLTRHEWPI